MSQVIIDDIAGDYQAARIDSGDSIRAQEYARVFLLARKIDAEVVDAAVTDAVLHGVSTKAPGVRITWVSEGN